MGTRTSIELKLRATEEQMYSVPVSWAANRVWFHIPLLKRCRNHRAARREEPEGPQQAVTSSSWTTVLYGQLKVRGEAGESRNWNIYFQMSSNLYPGCDEVEIQIRCFPLDQEGVAVGCCSKSMPLSH